MTTNERIDHTFWENGNLTLIVGLGTPQKRLLVSTRRMLERSRILGAAIINPAHYLPNHPRFMIRKPNQEHFQLYLLSDNPQAWMVLCAVLYPEAGLDIDEIPWSVKLEAAQYAVDFGMTVSIAKNWPKSRALSVLSERNWKDMWMAMNAAFLLEIPEEFDTISREIIYGYNESTQHIVHLSHDYEWAQRILAAMGDVRNKTRNSTNRIVGIASNICVEPVRFPSCDKTEEQCPHQSLLVREIWSNDENRRRYNNIAHCTPNQIRAFYSSLPYLSGWLRKAQIGTLIYYYGKGKAESEAEMFRRKWNSVEGPLGICLYCDAMEPKKTHKCKREYCRRIYGSWIAETFGGHEDESGEEPGQD